MTSDQIENERRISKVETTLTLTSDFMQKQFDELKEVVSTWFEKVWSKIDCIIEHSDSTYARKSELQLFWDRIKWLESKSTGTTLWRIKNRGLIIVALVSWLSSLLVALAK